MSDVIRYIDSAGWHWQVCEVADRRGGDAPADDAHPDEASPRPAAATSAPLADMTSADMSPADMPPADMPQTEGPPGQLYFFSRLGTRRTRRYPAAWPSLPPADLEALCYGAPVLGAARLG